MNASTPAGLGLVPRYFRLPVWLDGLRRRDLISAEVHTAAAGHFGLLPGPAAWLFFMARLLVYLGAIFLACGLIFWVAWNWENLPRQGKFALLEGVFFLCAAWCALRRSGTWDAPAALLGTCLVVGALLALFGQVYQTGADSWELFRAWSLILLCLVPAGRNAGLWFLIWLVGSLAVALYLLELYNLEKFSELTGLLALTQFLFLILGESADLVPGTAFDSRRGLRRLTGAAAFLMLTAHIFAQTFNNSHYGSFGLEKFPLSLSYLFYALCLGAAFWVYFRLRPDLFLLACAIFSLASFLGFQGILNLRFHNIVDFLIAGLIILGLCLGSAKLLTLLRRDIRRRSSASEGASARKEQETMLEDQERGLLESWLLAQNALAQPTLEGFFQQDEQKRDKSDPWFSKVFLTIGIWLGSGTILAFLSLALFSSFSEGMGFCGLLFCAASLWLERQKSFTLRQLSRVLGLCGLAYSTGLAGFSEDAFLFLALIFGFFWLCKKHLVEKTASFIGMLCCVYFYSSHLLYLNYFRQAPPTVFFSTYFYSCLCALGLLFVLYHYSRPICPVPAKSTLASLIGGAAPACLIFFSATLLLQLSGVPHHFSLPVYSFFLPVHRFTLPLVAIIALVFLRHKIPAERNLLISGGAVLLAASYFIPAAGLGLALILWGRASGKDAFSLLAAVYLGTAVSLYYYNLNLLLRDKALVLMGTGLALILVSVLARLRHKAQENVSRPAVPAGNFRNVLSRALPGVVFLLFLAFYNVSILQKENLLEHGRKVILALAPLDPRSLMQGDYMILNFHLESDIRRALPADAPRRGLAVLRLKDDEGIFSRLRDGAAPGPEEILLEFKQTSRGIRVSSGTYFFEEELGKLYSNARFAELRVDTNGKALIKALLDKQKIPLHKADLRPLSR